MWTGGCMRVKFIHMRKESWIKTVIAIIISIAITVLLMICCMIYTTGMLRTTVQRLINDFVITYSVYEIHSHSSILSYLDYKETNLDRNVVVTAMNRVLPIHTYFVCASDIKLDDLSQEEKKQTLDVVSSKMDQFLYYNGGSQSQGIQREATSNADETGMISMISGESYFEDETTQTLAVDQKVATKPSFFTLNELSDYKFFIQNCYTVDATTVADKETFNAKKLLGKDLSIAKDEEKPQILIYHTHSQEAFYDSRKGEVSDTIVGVGDTLAQILQDEYGYEVIHDRTTYDLIDGKLDRNLAYNVALPSIQKTLEYNPSIQVVIDLHRDGVPEGLGRKKGKRVVTINKQECAQIMLFNGVSRNKNGPIEWLKNPNLEGNLAFSLQVFKEGRSLYGNLLRPIYLKSYRFNLHLKERSLLVELGTQYNTVAEAKNSMKYLAQSVANVLNGVRVKLL